MFPLNPAPALPEAAAILQVEADAVQRSFAVVKAALRRFRRETGRYEGCASRGKASAPGLRQQRVVTFGTVGSTDPRNDDPS